MKDALGHGSNATGAAALASGPKSAPVPVHSAMANVIPDKAWRLTMPLSNYTGQVQDMLGMWAGTQTPTKLTAAETKQVSDAYESGFRDWRTLAGNLHSQRHASGAPH
jgi:hypothetical protein